MSKITIIILLFRYYHPLEKKSFAININILNSSPHPSILCAKFGCNRPSESGKEDSVKKSMYSLYLNCLYLSLKEVWLFVLVEKLYRQEDMHTDNGWSEKFLVLSVEKTQMISHILGNHVCLWGGQCLFIIIILLVCRDEISWPGNWLIAL